jgi:hypothetical protein
LTRLGWRPMRWDNGTPGPATWGVPDCIKIFLTLAGVNGAPFLALARPCRHATGDALEVPENRSVYHLFSEAGARSKGVGWDLYLTVCSLFQSVIQQPGQPDSGLSKPGSDNRAGFLYIIVGELDR